MAFPDQPNDTPVQITFNDMLLVIGRQTMEIAALQSRNQALAAALQSRDTPTLLREPPDQ